MRRFRHLSLGLLAFFALVQSASALTIADARQLPLGTIVTIEGSVTVPSGDFASSTFDQGFAIQDATAGIYVSTADNPNLNFHQKVEVTGELADDGYGLLVVRPASLADVVRLRGAHHIEAEDVATGNISEATEGLLVEVEGTVTRIVNDLPYGYQVFIDDGTGETQVFIPASTGINPFQIPFVRVGSAIEVTGFSSQFLAQYEVLPRHRGDIHRDH